MMARTKPTRLLWRVWFRHPDTDIYVSLCVIASGKIQARGKATEFVQRYVPTPIFYTVQGMGTLPEPWAEHMGKDDRDRDNTLTEVSELIEEAN